MSNNNKRLIPLQSLSIDNLQKVLDRGSFVCEQTWGDYK